MSGGTGETKEQQLWESEFLDLLRSLDFVACKLRAARRSKEKWRISSLYTKPLLLDPFPQCTTIIYSSYKEAVPQMAAAE